MKLHIPGVGIIDLDKLQTAFSTEAGEDTVIQIDGNKMSIGVSFAKFERAYLDALAAEKGADR